MMLTFLFSLFILISATLHIRAEYKGPRTQVYIFKPLTTSLILLMALLSPVSVSVFYKYAVVAGLLFSLGGDVFLMLPSDRFVAGLVSFLVGHLCYIAAFVSVGGFYTSGWGLLPFLLYGIIIAAILLPSVPGPLRGPVVAYILVILVMAWQALGNWQSLRDWGQTGQSWALLAFAGATFFVISDSVLAIDRFRLKFKAARLTVLSTYFLAQWLIALSV